MGVTNVETSLVFSPKSFLPRSATANLTAYFYGRAHNLLEVSLISIRFSFLKSYQRLTVLCHSHVSLFPNSGRPSRWKRWAAFEERFRSLWWRVCSWKSERWAVRGGEEDERESRWWPQRRKRKMFVQHQQLPGQGQGHGEVTVAVGRQSPLLGWCLRWTGRAEGLGSKLGQVGLGCIFFGGSTACKFDYITYCNIHAFCKMMI